MSDVPGHKHFLTQMGFSAVGLFFVGGMLAAGRDATVYLPILTSILFAWLPSPMNVASSLHTLPIPLSSIMNASGPRRNDENV
jgi:hypothetical protein